jgi:molybdopterin converting factor small subunit
MRIEGGDAAVSRETIGEGRVTFYVPRELRVYCGGASALRLSAASVQEALLEVERRYPSLYGGICDETGAVRRHLNVFVNSSHVRDREGLNTVLEPGDEVLVLPAVSGG